MDSYIYRTIRKEDLMIIKQLWEKLNNMHLADSIYFKEHFSSFTFEKRISKFQSYDEDSIMIEIVEAPDGRPAGYCIATIGKDGTGEIDSIFIDESHRGNRIGDRLMRDCIAWLEQHGCAPIRVAVAHGHESVFPFYQKYGFFPRMTLLERK